MVARAIRKLLPINGYHVSFLNFETFSFFLLIFLLFFYFQNKLWSNLIIRNFFILQSKYESPEKCKTSKNKKTQFKNGILFQIHRVLKLFMCLNFKMLSRASSFVFTNTAYRNPKSLFIYFTINGRCPLNRIDT